MIRLPDKARLVLRRGVTLANLLDRLAGIYGTRTAFDLLEASALTRSDRITFEDAAGATARLATALSRAAVLPGERVAILTANGADYLLSILAAIRAGAVAVPVNPGLKAPEITTLLASSGATTVLCDATTASMIPSGLSRLSLGPAGAATDLATVARAVRSPLPLAERTADDVVAILYTSGTTGTPKGARLTSDGLLSMTGVAALNPTVLPLMKAAVTALPQAHIMGFATSLMFLCSGMAHHLIGRFDAATVLAELERTGADVFVGVPAMYRALLDAGAEKRSLRGVRVWASAADVMPPDLAKRFQSFGRLLPGVHALFVEAYGMVETSGAALLRVYAPGLRAPSAMPLPPYRIRIVDERGRPVRRGATGELCVKGPGVLHGYEGDAERVVEDGWLRTGDLARAGLLGGVTLVGRKKEVIKVGGYSVFPVEVEEEIRRHPGVADAAVVGLPDERLGAVPAAAVVLEPGASVTTGALETWAKDAIASYRRPRAWRVVGSLPRGATRKVDKPAVAALFEPGPF